MGAGKTAVGRALAVRLGREFIDLDAVVAQKAARSIQDIFAFDGEPAFRRMEAEAVRQAAASRDAVIACGGGIVLDQANINILKQSSVMVYLAAEPSILLRRVLNSKEKRPLLQVADPASAMGDLLNYRKPLYEKAADIIMDTSQLDLTATVDRVCEELKRYESVNFEKPGTGQG